MFFDNIKIIKSPKKQNKVVFACDNSYFRLYGFYNLISCNNHNHDVHVHIINPDDQILKILTEIELDVDLSVSTEYFDTTDINKYKLKSYYFCARYFITNYLFDNNLIETALIVDADVVFNDTILFPDEVNLGVLYYPDNKTLWKQSGGNVFYITDKRKDFLKKFISVYFERIENTNFDSINDNMNKLVRGDLTGLDQVCISILMKNESDFLYLNQLEKFIGKNLDYRVWSLTGGGKTNPKVKSILDTIVPTKYKSYDKKIRRDF